MIFLSEDQSIPPNPLGVIAVFIVLFFIVSLTTIWYYYPKLKDFYTKRKRKKEEKLEKKSEKERLIGIIDEGNNKFNERDFSNALKLFEKARENLRTSPYPQYYKDIQNTLKSKIKVVQNKLNALKVEEINSIIEQGTLLKNQNLIDKAMETFKKALENARNLFKSPEKVHKLKEIKINIDDIYLIQIEILIEQGDQLKSRKSINESLKILNNALGLSDKLFSSKEKNKIIYNIKKNIDSIYSDMINDIIENGNRLKKDMEFDNSINIFKDGLKIANKILISNKMNNMISKLNSLIYQAQVAKIKNTILNLGVKFDRLHVSEIAEKCKESEEYIINTALNMINKKEIYAEYFKSTKSVVFDKQANIDEIDALMDQYKKWEEKGVGKK